MSEEVTTRETPTLEEQKEPETRSLTARKVDLSREQEAQMFKSLTHKSYKEVGHDFGLHHFYNTEQKVRAAVMNVVRKVKKAPEIYGISQEVVELVSEASASRSIKQNPRIKMEILQQEESFKDKLDGIRDTTAEILKKKLEKANRSSKSIDEISYRDLKDILATTIDKSRLLRGESTERVLHLAKLDTENLTPEEALKVIMKAREALVESKK